MQIQKLPSVRSLVYTPVYLFILIFFCLSIILGVITALFPEPDLTGGFTTDSIVLDWLITVIAVKYSLLSDHRLTNISILIMMM